jgi:glycosyltransferase involved in cell wall biosynthesis
MFKNYIFNINNVNEVVYSIVIPVYNQENIIVQNLKSIINNTLENFEIIIILDFCFDNTEINLIKYLDNYINDKPNLIQIKIFKNSNKPLFETKCDNIGFKNSTGKYCLEIQADMEMTELGYNIHLTKPFKLLNNVLAVSGRCAHKLFVHDGFGKLGIDIEKPVSSLNVNKNSFYVLETCNRGPLLLDREKLKELNYLDEDEYFLDNSDHDLMARAFLYKNYICGYVPIDFNAPLCDGSTRKKNFINCKEYLINIEEKNRLNNLCNNKPGLNKYKKIWKNREPIIYNLQ